MEEHGRSGNACKRSHECTVLLYLAVERFTFDILLKIVFIQTPPFSFAYHLMSDSLYLLDKGNRCLFTAVAAMQTGSRSCTNTVSSVFSFAVTENIVSQDRCQ